VRVWVAEAVMQYYGYKKFRILKGELKNGLGASAPKSLTPNESLCRPFRVSLSLNRKCNGPSPSSGNYSTQY